MVVRLAPVWMGTLMFNVTTVQVPSLFVQQGQTVDRRLLVSDLSVPSFSMQTVTSLTVLFSVPIYDLVIVPLIKRYTKNEGGLSLLQRMGCGMHFSILAMVAAALVENHNLRNSVEKHVPFSIFWLILQYVLEGLGEVFTSVGQLEFFYDQAPDGMRSLGTALDVANIKHKFIFYTKILHLYVAVSFDSLLTTLVNHNSGDSRWIRATTLNRGHLNYYYWVLAAMGSVNLVLYTLSAICYRYKKVDTSAMSVDLSLKNFPRVCMIKNFTHFKTSRGSELGLILKPALLNHIHALKLTCQQSAGNSPMEGTTAL